MGNAPPHGSDGSEEPASVRRSPSGRIPQWALDEAVGMTTQPPSPWRDHSPAVQPRCPRRRKSPHRRSRRRFLRALLVTVTIVALVAGSWFYSGRELLAPVDAGGPRQIGGLLTGQGLLPSANERPTPGFEAANTPLGTPAPLQRHSESYRFLRAGAGGQPFVAYDPCRPVHYVIRPDLMPSGGEQLIAEAVLRTSAATGLQFRYDGLSEEDPAEDRALVQQERYGDRWAPVLIAWVTPDKHDAVAGDTIGIGGSTSLAVSGSPVVYVTGSVLLDAPQMQGLLALPGGYEQARAIIQHELGHVLGLDHVEDPTQLMHAESTMGLADFGTGDLTGLAELGRGPCAPML